MLHMVWPVSRLGSRLMLVTPGCGGWIPAVQDDQKIMVHSVFNHWLLKALNSDLELEHMFLSTHKTKGTHGNEQGMLNFCSSSFFLQCFLVAAGG